MRVTREKPIFQTATITVVFESEEELKEAREFFGDLNVYYAIYDQIDEACKDRGIK